MKNTILIVDFDQEFIKELQDILQTEDFRFLQASDGQEALKVFEAQTPDLVLTAALLPKLNGFELCKKITSGELGESRPVIMYSAIYKAEKYRKEATLGCGALEFLEKPIPKWQLLKVVKAAFSQIPTGKQDEAMPSAAGLPVSESPVLALGEPEGNPTAAEDLLEVDTLFETLEPSAVVPVSIHSEVAVGTPVPEVVPSSSLSSIDSKEIDAAVDAFRTDLEDEVRQRDDRLAQQFEKEFLEKGQTILEFEASLAGHISAADSGIAPDSKVAKDDDQVFELDEFDMDATRASEAGPLEFPMESTERPEETTMNPSFPEFSVKPIQSRNWLPLIILAICVLAVLFFWLFKG